MFVIMSIGRVSVPYKYPWNELLVQRLTLIRFVFFTIRKLTNAFSISSSVLVARSESHKFSRPLIRCGGNCFDKISCNIWAPSTIQYCSCTVVGNSLIALNLILESFPWNVFANRSNWNIWIFFLLNFDLWCKRNTLTNPTTETVTNRLSGNFSRIALISSINWWLMSLIAWLPLRKYWTSGISRVSLFCSSKLEQI